MELTYTMRGDYRLPNLIPPESPKVGKYGMLRHSYIDGPFDTLEDAAEEVRGYHPHASQIAGSASDVEEDTFDDVNPQQVREELAKSGIVDGKLVDPEALENTPFIRQVMADAGAAASPPSLPILPHSQDRLHPEVSADDRRNYHISTSDLGIGVPLERFYHNVHAIELLHIIVYNNIVCVCPHAPRQT